MKYLLVLITVLSFLCVVFSPSTGEAATTTTKKKTTRPAKTITLQLAKTTIKIKI